MPSPVPHSSRRAWPLLLSNVLDASGRQSADLAVDVLAVVALGATAAQMGLLNALGTLAFLVLGIPVGVLVDRSPTARLLAVSGVVRAGLLGSLFVAWATGGLTIVHVYVVAALAGTAAVVVETTQSAIVPRIVGTGRVAHLVSRLESAESVVALLVPAAAGAVVALVGAGPTLAVSAALIAVAALVVLRLRLVQVQQPAAPGTTTAGGAMGRFFHEARQGWGALRGRRVLWRLSLASMTINLGLAVHGAVEVVLVLRTLDLGATVLGLVVSAGALGGLIGSLVAVPLSRTATVATVLRASLWALPPVAALSLLALLDTGRATLWLLTGSFFWGLFMVTYNIVNAGLTAELTPGELLGRVSATRRSFTMGIVPVGSILGGVLADQAGVAWAVAAWVVLNAAGAVIAGKALAGRGADMGSVRS